MKPYWRDREPEEVEKTFLLSTGTKLYFRQYPPHGFWRVSFERGDIPAKLQGDFNSLQDLYKKNRTLSFK